MKRILFVLAFCFGAFQLFAQPEQLKSFDELMKALNSGENVRVIIYYAKCQLIADNKIEDKSPEAVGGMNIETYEYFAPQAVKNDKAFVVASTNKFIQNPKGNGYVYNYAKIRVNADNSVRLTVNYINPLTLEELMDESFYCEINDGKNEKAVYFYKSN